MPGFSFNRVFGTLVALEGYFDVVAWAATGKAPKQVIVDLAYRRVDKDNPDYHSSR